MPRMTTLTLLAGLAAACAPPSPASSSGAAASVPLATQPQTTIRCEPGQQAVVTQRLAGGQVTTDVGCVGAFAQTAQAGSAMLSPAGGDPGLVTMSPSTSSQLVPTPVSYQPVSAVPAVYEQPVRRVAPGRVAYDDVVRVQRPGRSWQKRALVIGGTTGIGAGLGGLIGGKKGALIGAAIGGGGATLYEVSRHNRDR